MATVKMVALAQFIASKVGATGLTVTCDVDEYDADNSSVDNAYLTAQSMTHVRNGIYRLFFDGDDSLLYVATAKTADSSVDQQHIPAVVVRLERVNNADVKTSTRNATTPLDSTATQAAAAAALTAYDAPTKAELDSAIAGIPVDLLDDEEASAGVTIRQAIAASGSASDPMLNEASGYPSNSLGGIIASINPAQVTVTSPVATDGTSITVVRGDDYLNTDGRALTFTGATWPTLTGGAVALKVATGAAITTYTGTVTGAQACRVELTDTQTAALAAGVYAYDLEATLAGGSVVTLVQGTLRVAADVRS